MMSGTGNKLSAQEDLNGCEDLGAGTAEPISQNGEFRVDGENLWAPLTMAATVGNNPVATSPAALLNHMMQWGVIGRGNSGGGAALMEGALLHHLQMQQQRQCSYNKWGVARYYGLH